VAIARPRLRLSILAVTGFEGAQKYILWCISQAFITILDVYIVDVPRTRIVCVRCYSKN